MKFYAALQRNDRRGSHTNVSYMKKLRIYFYFLLLLASCKKSNNTNDPPHPCSVANSACSHKPGDIIGSWLLQSYGGYMAPNVGKQTWIPADCSKPVVIEFKDDSIFSYNSNFSLSGENFDRFKMTDQQHFEIYSSNPPSGGPYHPLFGTIVSSSQIEITDMGVDTGTEYNYDCNQ